MPTRKATFPSEGPLWGGSLAVGGASRTYPVGQSDQWRKVARCGRQRGMAAHFGNSERNMLPSSGRGRGGEDLHDLLRSWEGGGGANLSGTQQFSAQSRPDCSDKLEPAELVHCTGSPDFAVGYQLPYFESARLCLAF